jgi:hypothetical protein
MVNEGFVQIGSDHANHGSDQGSRSCSDERSRSFRIMPVLTTLKPAEERCSVLAGEWAWCAATPHFPTPQLSTAREPGFMH